MTRVDPNRELMRCTGKMCLSDIEVRVAFVLDIEFKKIFLQPEKALKPSNPFPQHLFNIYILNHVDISGSRGEEPG